MHEVKLENAHKNYAYYSTLPTSQTPEVEEGVQAMNSSSFGFRREGLGRQVGLMVVASYRATGYDGKSWGKGDDGEPRRFPLFSAAGAFKNGCAGEMNRRGVSWGVGSRSNG